MMSDEFGQLSTLAVLCKNVVILVILNMVDQLNHWFLFQHFVDIYLLFKKSRIVLGWFFVDNFHSIKFFVFVGLNSKDMGGGASAQSTQYYNILCDMMFTDKESWGLIWFSFIFNIRLTITNSNCWVTYPSLNIFF